ncbi:MAG: hypothetical protein JNG86_08425, partial [Verrucomicrobiaceae bacterium]|nr:hypothetical protein [Verrucomicrobiaceae bacterium]
AMRNLARGSQSPEDTALLKTKTAEMLRNKEWRTKPSAGYLEAFDVIVHTQNTALAPDLLNLCEDRDQRGTRHAAFLTLDRLAMAKPAELLPELAEFAAKHPSSRLMVSNMVARADIRVPEQRQALENYLLDERRAPDELRAFASVFPNGNVSVSQNLLTRAPVLQGADLAAQDRVALETMTAWLEDPRFAKVREPLAEACKRLHGFVNGQRGSK